MLYVQLDVNWPDNAKIIRAGWECAGVHAALLSIAKRLEGDGWIDDVLLARYGFPDGALGRLVALGLVEAGEGRHRPSDWHERNPSQAAIAATRASKQRAGKSGNHTRYGHPGPLDSCRTCFPPEDQKPSVLAPATAEARTDLAPSLPPLLSNPEEEVGSSLPSGVVLDFEHRPSPKIPDENRSTASASLAAIRSSIHPTLNGGPRHA